MGHHGRLPLRSRSGANRPLPSSRPRQPVEERSLDPAGRSPSCRSIHTRRRRRTSSARSRERCRDGTTRRRRSPCRARWRCTCRRRPCDPPGRRASRPGTEVATCPRRPSPTGAERRRLQQLRSVTCLPERHRRRGVRTWASRWRPSAPRHPRKACARGRANTARRCRASARTPPAAATPGGEP